MLPSTSSNQSPMIASFEIATALPNWSPVAPSASTSLAVCDRTAAPVRANV